jgi:spore coat protein U-like protein
MKTIQFKSRAVNLALAAILAVAGSAFGVDSYAGTDTATLNVSATITANCTIDTTPLAFGAYDPIVAHTATALDGTGTVTTTCTDGSAVHITLGQGTYPAGGSTDTVPLRQMASGDNRLAYFLYSNDQRTQVWGNDTESDVADTGTGLESVLTIYGSVPSGQNLPAGTYTDTVVATVTF